MIRRYESLLAGGLPYLVAKIDKAVAGYAYAGPYRPRPAYRFSLKYSIDPAPKAQGRGTGTKLLQTLIDESASRGYRQMVCRDRRLRQCRLDRACTPALAFRWSARFRTSASSSAGGWIL